MNFPSYNRREPHFPNSYNSHAVFDDIEFMMDFYEHVSYKSSDTILLGTRCTLNFESDIFSAIEGTLDSIGILLKRGRINDALSLVRKLFDDILAQVYLNVILKEKCDIFGDYFVKDVDDWIFKRFRIPKVEKILKKLKQSDYTKSLYPFFGWNTYLKDNREILDDSMHANRFKLLMLNCNKLQLDGRENYLDNCKVILSQLFSIHLSFIFVLNPEYLVASDYINYLDCGVKPPVGSECWIASFAKDAFDKAIKPNAKLAEYITTTSWLEIDG